MLESAEPAPPGNAPQSHAQADRDALDEELNGCRRTRAEDNLLELSQEQRPDGGGEYAAAAAG
jgi:hypothetical protein